MTKLAIICPCYNEEAILYQSASKLLNIFNSLKISEDSFILFVNDGSTDETWNIIKELHKKNNKLKGVQLAFNSGHQNALMAGMMYAKDKIDCAITIDVDLQDDLNCIPEMLDKYENGCDVVYGVKTDRNVDGVAKKSTANGYYKIQKMMGINIIPNHADFRLVSNKVIKALSGYRESNLYLRGIIPSLGFKSSIVEDKISPRVAGDSKYTKRKMFRLATDGITSFSSAPLKVIFWIGVISIIVAFINIVDVIVALCNGTAIPGWSQLMFSLWFIGGTILISIGLLGIYIGRIYNESKKRPQYIVLEELN